MKSEVKPAVFWALLVVIAVVVIGVGYKLLGSPGYKAQNTGSEDSMAKAARGEFYKPPPGVVPSSTSTSSPPGGGSGYNLRPPSH